MKHIILAKKSKRIISGLVDLLILIISSVVIFLTVVMPLSFNSELYKSNGLRITTLYAESGLFLTQENGSYAGKSTITRNINSVEDLHDVNLIAWETTFSHQNLSKDLYTFYTTKYINYGNDYNFTHDTYLSDVLKVGSEESNIASIDTNTFAINMINSSKGNVTLDFFLAQYEAASVSVDKSSAIAALKNENSNMMLISIALIIPVIFVFGFIYSFLIPCLNKTRRSIGKMIFKLDVISKTSYQLPTSRLFVRFLFYTVVEVIGGFITFGGMFLITYTTFLFTKNRRALHDLVSASVVIDAQTSVYFLNKEEEEYFEKRGLNNAQKY